MRSAVDVDAAVCMPVAAANDVGTAMDVDPARAAAADVYVAALMDVAVVMRGGGAAEVTATVQVESALAVGAAVHVLVDMGMPARSACGTRARGLVDQRWRAAALRRLLLVDVETLVGHDVVPGVVLVLVGAADPDAVALV